MDSTVTLALRRNAEAAAIAEFQRPNVARRGVAGMIPFPQLSGASIQSVRQVADGHVHEVQYVWPHKVRKENTYIFWVISE